MPRVGLSPAAVVDAAIAIIDEGGPSALTFAGVAARTGVAAPSLYKHVGSVAELSALVVVRVMEEMAADFASAVIGRSGADAVAALMRAYRQYAVRYPARYAAMPADPLRQHATAAAGEKLMRVILGVLRAYGLEGSAAVHATRCMRAVVHGFASIESAGGFGLAENVDDSYDHLIHMVTTHLSGL